MGPDRAGGEVITRWYSERTGFTPVRLFLCGLWSDRSPGKAPIPCRRYPEKPETS
jgi:hypothetical protein